MRYAEWNKLTDEERQSKHWRHHPRVRVATIFSIVFAVVLFFILLRVMQNTRVHVNRKPNEKEAFTVAKTFVADKLKQPATATFPKNDYTAKVDTAANKYDIQSTLKEQDSTGSLVQRRWQVQMAYKGGDWADKRSWQLTNVEIGK